MQLSQSVLADPAEQVLQVEWQVVQMVSVAGFTKKLPSGQEAVHVFEFAQ